MFSQQFKSDQMFGERPTVFGEPVVGKRITLTEAFVAVIAPLVVYGRSASYQTNPEMQADALIHSVADGLVTHIEVISSSENLPRILALSDLESYLISEI